MTSIASKTQKFSERSKTSIAKPKLNCMDFSQSPTPELKELENFLFVEYVGQRHMHPERVSSARSRDVASLKITYFTAEHISYLEQTSNNLQRLDLSNSNLFKLPLGIICNMNQLKVLILDQNQLTEASFCKEFCSILGNSLKELSICSNSISFWPDILSNLGKLQRLKIMNNSISSIKGIESFKRLKILNIDYNQLIQLGNGFYSMKRLEYIYASHNLLTSISTAIKHMAHLKEIDLSYNSIKTVPSDIFQLQQLEILKLNNNKIGKLPRFKISGKLAKSIMFVDLSNNNIVRFPDCVMRVTDELDLSNNKIRLISPNVLKKYSYSTQQKLILTNNPLSSPPKEICESGLKCMIQFYQDSNAIAKNYYGLKIFCLGSENIDKLNIITSLIDQNEEDDSLTEKENILEIFDTAFEINDDDILGSKLLNLQFLDILAEKNDSHWLMLFATCPALILIFVDIDNYSQESFMNSVGSWLQQIIIKQNELSFMLVGITNNNLNNDYLDILNAVKSDITQFFNSYVDRIIDEIFKIESQTKIDSAKSLALKKFIQLKSIKILLHEKCILINPGNIKSIKALQKEIIIMSTQTTAFKKVMNAVPSFWSDAQLYFEEEAYKCPLISINEYEALIQQKFNLKPAAYKIANFLHETGYFLWWENSQSPLNQWIITCPFSLVECLRILFRLDLKSYLLDPSDPDRIHKRFKKRFNKSKYSYKECCNILFTKSILLPELATILWENILPLKSVIRMLYYLCECWSLGYPIDYPNYSTSTWIDLNSEINETHAETLSSIDSIEYRLKSADSVKSVGANQNKIPPVCFPWFLTRGQVSEEANKKWLTNKGFRISICYKFPCGFPNIISEQILVRANNREKLQTTLMDHWKDGIQAEIVISNIIFRIYRNNTPNKKDIVKFEFRHCQNFNQIDLKDEEAKNCLSVIWESMLKFLTDTDEFLESYKGLWFERLIECPFCHELSFSGTWNASGDSLPDEDKLCQLCGKLVPPHFLGPPKFNKNVSAEEIIQNIRRQYDRD